MTAIAAATVPVALLPALLTRLVHARRPHHSSDARATGRQFPPPGAARAADVLDMELLPEIDAPLWRALVDLTETPIITPREKIRLEALYAAASGTAEDGLATRREILTCSWLVNHALPTFTGIDHDPAFDLSTLDGAQRALAHTVRVSQCVPPTFAGWRRDEKPVYTGTGVKGACELIYEYRPRQASWLSPEHTRCLEEIADTAARISLDVKDPDGLITSRLREGFLLHLESLVHTEAWSPPTGADG
ncbi:hypothetical protein [Brachybacterium kimchii]|uniref:Uncharacterized protein n=1 Tax=Brachybacterium kimchii TaxID=2942909 RepID=A0ABY4NAU9_9MICO|nr:hypothetical protein [Brachybacterium kimchii]UQN30499.1 hypothetical protein M4486_03915 [Brachybacterium kimchii]